MKTSTTGVTTTLAVPQSHPMPVSGSTITVYDYVFTGVTVDGFDNICVAESSVNGSPRELILKITPTGAVVTTISVSANVLFTNRAPNPCSIAADRQGNIFTVGVDGAIYEIKADGTQLTVASDQWFADLNFFYPDPPQGLVVDDQDNLFMSVTRLNPSRYAGLLELMVLTPAPVITFQPQGATIPFGTSRQLSATAASSGLLTYQWYLDGSLIPGAAGTMAAADFNSAVASYSATLPGIYTIVINSTAGSITSDSAAITAVTVGGVSVVATPTITTQPKDTVLSFGGTVGLSVTSVATLPMTYQWRLNGAPLSGATAASYAANLAGTYTVVVTTSVGSVISDPAVVVLANRPVNISSRAAVGTGANISIAGFVVSSYSGAMKSVLVRAVGPGLTQLGVTGILAQPILSVYDSSGRLIATNTGWNNSAVIAAAAGATGAFALPAGSADSALLLDLAPGNYTAQVSGVNSATGVALVEVYEMAPDGGHFVNISTRAAVGTNANILIGGLVVGGTQPSQVLIRAVGPGLTQLGVSGVLAQPILSVYNSAGQLIAVNIGWSNGASADAVAEAAAAAKTGAFPLPPGSADSAVLLTLAPGTYTAQVSGVNNGTGIALVEFYQVPQ